MRIYITLMAASVIAAFVGLMVRDKDVKLILWPLAYGLMSAAMLLK